MATAGGIILQGELDQLEAELLDYYGYENMVRAGLQTAPVEKPAALIRYEMVNSLNLPLVDGGIVDQPHIYLFEYAICHRVKTLIEAMRNQNNAIASTQANG